MSPLCRFDPVESELLEIEPEFSQFIDKIILDDFSRSFSGHHLEVNRQFSLPLREIISQIGNLRLVISKDLINQDTKLPQKGKIWFKKKKINTAKWKHFLLTLLEYFNDKHGYPAKSPNP